MIGYYLYQPFPLIDLNDIVLREIVDTDADDYFHYMSKSEMIEYLTIDTMPKDLDAALNDVRYWGSLFRNKRSFYWGIALKNNNKLIGTCGFNSISPIHLRGEISYDLNPDFWGKGIMLRSMKSILKFSDNALGLIRIQATVVINNSSSIKLLERCNFMEEGVLRKYEIVNSEHRDYYMYSRVI